MPELYTEEQIEVIKKHIETVGRGKAKKKTVFKLRDGTEFSLPKSIVKADNGQFYALGSTIAEGNFGVVRHAVDIETGDESFAIKRQTIKQATPSQQKRSLVKGIEREQSIQQEIGQFKGKLERFSQAKLDQKERDMKAGYDLKLYTVMPLLEGKSLLTKIDSHLQNVEQVFDEEKDEEKLNLIAFTLNLGETTARELAKWHGKGILHRDLHLGNILVNEKGKAIIIDPGRAGIIDPKTKMVEEPLYQAGMDHIWSPQMLQMRKKKGNEAPYQFSTADDLYSLGLCMSWFKMLTVLNELQEDDEFLEKTGIKENDVKRLNATVVALKSKEPRNRPSAEEVANQFAKVNKTLQRHIEKTKKYSISKKEKASKKHALQRSISEASTADYNERRRAAFTPSSSPEHSPETHGRYHFPDTHGHYLEQSNTTSSQSSLAKSDDEVSERSSGFSDTGKEEDSPYPKSEKRAPHYGHKFKHKKGESSTSASTPHKHPPRKPSSK